MRRGRIFLYLALIIILLLVIAGIWWVRQNQAQPTTPPTQPTPAIRTIEIVVAGQNIYPGRPITEDMLATIPIPESQLVVGEFTNKADLVGLYPKIAIPQGVPIMDTMVSRDPGFVNLPGSTWANYIPNGFTAIPIPINRLSSVAFGIRSGDYVNVIATLMIVDVDTAFQAILPNQSAGVVVTQGDRTFSVVPIIESPESLIPNAPVNRIGRGYQDEDLQQFLYIVPSERQRPRLVSKMILQRVQVLHVGNFPLVGDQIVPQPVAPGTTPTPAPANQEQQAPAVERPDIVTLLVPNQDAVTLTWLLFSGAKLTLTLRNPNDLVNNEVVDAVTLEYLLTQYKIDPPTKLPYAIEPRVDQLKFPPLDNDQPAPQR